MRSIRPLLIGVLYLGGQGCSGEPTPREEPSANGAAQPSLPADPQIALRAEPVSSNEVRFVVTTNLPLPVEVMASVSLADQRPEATWIGHQQRVTLSRPTTTFVLHTSAAQRPLPRGSYEAEISFYPRWGAAGNSAAAAAPELHAVETVTLRGSGMARADAELRNERQRWVMEHVVMHTPWDEPSFVARLGRYEKSQAELSHLHDAYYFPGADMTLIVNRLLGEVTIWRIGRASR